MMAQPREKRFISLADYRQFCSSCNNEVGFGKHSADCPVPALVAALQKERREQRRSEEEKRREPFIGLSDEELIKKVIEINLKASEFYEAYLPYKHLSDAGKNIIRERNLTNKYLDALYEQES